MDYDDALRILQAAAENYAQKTQTLAAIRQCDSYWPGDLPVAQLSTGTRCQLLAGHDRDTIDGPPPTPHRHRMAGSEVVVTW